MNKTKQLTSEKYICSVRSQVSHSSETQERQSMLWFVQNVILKAKL